MYLILNETKQQRNSCFYVFERALTEYNYHAFKNENASSIFWHEKENIDLLFQFIQFNMHTQNDKYIHECIHIARFLNSHGQENCNCTKENCCRSLENKAEYLILNQTKQNRKVLFYAFEHTLTE